MKWLIRVVWAIMLLIPSACRRDAILYFPDFDYRKTDSSIVSSGDFSTGTPIVLICFKSTCKGCQQITDSLLRNIGQIKNTRIIFISREELPEVAHFERHYKLKSFPQITVGQDYNHFLAEFYSNPHTPIIAL